MTQRFDLCVIGTGSGNSIADPSFHRLYGEWSVAFIERGVFGGTCLNRGCIPSKMLIYPADVVESIRHADTLGIDAQVASVRWADIRDRTFGRIDPIAESGHRWRAGLDNCTLFDADARFVGDHELEVGRGDDAERIVADRFVIAAGARTMLPDIPGIDDVGVQTSDTIMRIDLLPQRLGVLGGGFIATEMAHAFGAFGSDVSLFVRRDELLPHEDEEISRRITERFAERFDLHLSTRVTRLAPSASGGVALWTESPAGQSVVEVDMVLAATGRVPNGDQLRVEATGVSLDQAGYVMTDNTLSTGVDGIWALGDVRNPLQLKHLANHEARVVRHNLVHPDHPLHVDERVVPHAVFTSPQIGSVGLTEHDAVQRGHRVVVAVREYGATAYGWAMEDTTSCAKVVVDRDTHLVLGLHVIGPQASILIQPVVQGMRFGQTAEQMASDVIYPHPALSEVVENVLLDAASQLAPAPIVGGDGGDQG